MIGRAEFGGIEEIRAIIVASTSLAIAGIGRRVRMLPSSGSVAAACGIAMVVGLATGAEVESPA